MDQYNGEDEAYKNMELFESFITAIQQEKLHPTILPFQQEKYNLITNQIKQQRAKLNDFISDYDDNELTLSEKNLRHKIYISQIQKIDYLLKMYLRIRLKKIQLYCFHLMKNELETNKVLSEKEMIFLKKYAEMRYQYYKDVVFKYLLKNYRDFKGIEIIFAKSEDEQRERKIFIESKQSQIELKAPNLNDYVFAQIQKNPNQLRFGLDISVSNHNNQQYEVISQGTIIFGPYKNIHERFRPEHYKLI